MTHNCNNNSFFNCQEVLICLNTDLGRVPSGNSELTNLCEAIASCVDEEFSKIASGSGSLFNYYPQSIVKILQSFSGFGDHGDAFLAVNDGVVSWLPSAAIGATYVDSGTGISVSGEGSLSNPYRPNISTSYVRNLFTATNGLNYSNGITYLGGPLTQNTTINGSAFNFTINNTNQLTLTGVTTEIKGQQTPTNFGSLSLNALRSVFQHQTGTGVYSVDLNGVSGLLTLGTNRDLALADGTSYDPNVTGINKTFFRISNYHQHPNGSVLTLLNKTTGEVGWSQVGSPTTYNNGLSQVGSVVKFGGTLSANTVLDLNSNRLSFNGGNIGVNISGNPLRRISIGNDNNTSTTGNLFLYSPNVNLSVIETNSSAELALMGGGTVSIKPDSFSSSGVVRFTNSGNEIIANFLNSSLDVVGQIGTVWKKGQFDYDFNEFYLKALDTGSEISELALYDKIRLINISQNNSNSKVITINSANNRVEWRDINSFTGVSSVGISSTELSVSNSPITNSGTISLGINNGVVTYSKIQNVTASKLLGRYSPTTGIAQEINLGGNLVFSGNTLTQLGRTLIKITRFDSDGVWVKAPGTTSALIYTVGGGGGGGGAASDASESAVGSGGGAGATTVHFVTSGLGATENVIVGMGGVGGSAATSTPYQGEDGTNSLFGFHTAAAGGSGGITMASGDTVRIISGGQGGAVLTPGNMFHTEGQAGDPGIRLGTASTQVIAARGGASHLGVYTGSTALDSNGGGGLGAAATNGATVNGGRGSNGLIIIYEFS